MSDIIERTCKSCGGLCCTSCFTDNFDNISDQCRIYEERPERCIIFPFRVRPYGTTLSNFCPVVREVAGDKYESTRYEIMQNPFLSAVYQQALRTSFGGKIDQESFIVT